MHRLGPDSRLDAGGRARTAPLRSVKIPLPKKLNVRDAIITELLDARDRCVYHGRGWALCDHAIEHLLELWLSQSRLHSAGARRQIWGYRQGGLDG